MSIFQFIDQTILLSESQSKILSQLEDIIDLLAKPTSIFNKVFARKTYPSGIYLYGSIGSGKTMIMRAFYAKFAKSKQILHYQDFMQKIHNQMHNLRSNIRNKLISTLAKDYARQSKLICLDEFEIHDITDAMIINEFITNLIQLKVFIFITSNLEPKHLYSDGLQRESFLPFIDLLYKHFEVLKLNSNIDYRLSGNDIRDRIVRGTDADNKARMDHVITLLTHNNLYSNSLSVFGRKVHFKRTYNKILATNFNELFMQDLGYVDYVHICRYFKTIILEDVNYIEDRNILIKFINFIDNAYFYKILLFISLVDDLDKIYDGDFRAKEFKRTISRLNEMNSENYISIVDEEH
ncbi:MAG: cell division protein ZapE [Rickettsiaceae bacterium]